MEGEPAASTMAKELRQPRGGGGQVRPPRPGGAPPGSATTSTAERAPPRGEARARAGTRPAAGGDPRQRHDKHARDRDQGGAGGQQTATAHTSRGDLRTRPHTDEVLTRLRGKTTVTGAARQRRRDPARPRIPARAKRRQPPPGGAEAGPEGPGRRQPPSGGADARPRFGRGTASCKPES